MNNKSFFKSSQELGLNDSEIAFMSRFESNLKMEVAPQYRKPGSVSIGDSLVFAAIAASLLCMCWSSAIYTMDFWSANIIESFGLSGTVLLILAGLIFTLISEVGLEVVGEFI